MGTSKPPIFVGREAEMLRLHNIINLKQSAILIVYGRRRIGKTALLEHVFTKRNLIKIEGLEKGGIKVQIKSAIQQVAAQLPAHPVTSWHPENWSDFFRLLGSIVKEGEWTLYLEEYQWLSCYRTQLTAELKLAWDNWFSKNQNLILILCGSSPSFMINKVVKSKSLHNRSHHEMHLRALPFQDARKLLPKNCTLREAFDAFLLVGGVPEYLRRLNIRSSCYLSFMHEAFSSDGFFVNEFQRLIVSSLAKNPDFEKIIRYLAKVRFAERKEIAKAIKQPPGGALTRLLDELTDCGLIRCYVPIDKPENSLLQRYALADPFLRTYFAQIVPRLSKIREGSYDKTPEKFLSYGELSAHLGLEFEEFCRANSSKIAKLLGFSAVDFKSGSYFSRVVSAKHPGYQLDLVFQRADHVHTVCEIKYTREPADISIIAPFERAVSIYHTKFKDRVHRVLISAAGANAALTDQHYFDDQINLDQLTNET